jgi:AraC-like DNA-binding protein
MTPESRFSNRRDIPDLPAMVSRFAEPHRGIFSYGRYEANVRDDPKRLGTHRHVFHELMIFESGRGVYSGDFDPVEVIAPAAVVIPAGTVHCWPEFDTLRGTACGFDLEFLRLGARTDEAVAVLMPPLMPVVPLKQETLARMHPWFSRMDEEWQDNGVGRLDLFRACLLALLVEVRRERNSHVSAPDAALSLDGRIYGAFLDELDRQVNRMPSVRDLAESLQLTPDYLSASLRQVCGQNASDLIAERVMLEAKRLLTHSRLSVAETAYALGFESPSYFTRFFKKHTDLSPRDFRQKEGS